MSDLPVLRSRLLQEAGFSHGFFTRQGGLSLAPFDSLNLSLDQGDDEPSVRENRQLVRQALDVRQLAFVRQVHGAIVSTLLWEPDSEIAFPSPYEADALISCFEFCAIGVLTADCAPILLADPGSGAVAAVHAGWRGTLADAAGAGVRALCDLARCAPRGLLAAIGPCIGPQSYAVSPELAQQFVARFGPQAVSAAEQPLLDLWRCNRLNLEAAGLQPQHIELLAEDTFSQPERFFSYRRGAPAGRQGSFIVAR